MRGKNSWNYLHYIYKNKSKLKFYFAVPISKIEMDDDWDKLFFTEIMYS